MEFPRLVYKSASVFVAVESEEDLEAKLADGWFSSVPEALAPKSATAPAAPAALAPKEPEVPADDAPPTRDELKAKAAELGLEFASNIPTDKLAALVAAALAPKE